MRNLLRHPLTVLLILTILATIRADRRGYFKPEIVPDTQSYERLLQTTTPFEALSGLRTYGYPLTLKTFGLVGDNWIRVPPFHFGVYLATIFLFWFALARFTRAPWLAFVATVPLLFSSVLDHVPRVGTDSLAASMGLASIALLLMLVTRPARIWPWVGLLATVFLAYFIRPVYQFLPLLILLLGVPLRLCYKPPGHVRVGLLAAGLGALTLLPLLLFSTARLRIVGEFGVGGMVGYHLGALGALMLDDQLLNELPASDRRLAGEVLAEHKKRNWRPMRTRSRSARYQRRFGLTMFRVCEPTVMRQVLEDRGLTRNEDGSTSAGPRDIPGILGATALEMDHRLGAMGRSILVRRPLVYLTWIRDAVRLGVAKLLAQRWVLWPLVLLAATIPYLLLRARRRPSPVESDSTGALGVTALALISLGFFIAHLCVVVLVHFPKDRYATAMAFLIPSFLVAALFELWRWILAEPSEL